MRIHLSEHFTCAKLIRFVLPSVATVLFTSVYSIVDGLFVSLFVGKVSFAAINLVYPILMILGAVGGMIGTGGSAIVGKTLGEKQNDKASEYFSMLIYVTFAMGAVFAVAGFFVLPTILEMLGAQGDLLANGVIYGRIVLVGLPFFVTEFTFQSFFVTAEKPKLGLAVTIFGGVLNIVLDAVFIILFKWGLVGAALATVISQTLCVAAELIYFARKNDSLLRLTRKTKFDGKIFLNACTNGLSEMVNSAAFSIIAMLYNYQLIKYIGENGVAAYGVAGYVGFIFASIFFGYELGVSPAVSYQFGARDYNELKNLLRKSLMLVGTAGVIMFVSAELLAPTFANIFFEYDHELRDLTVHAFRIQAVSFLFLGFASFGSAFFTALNNGFLSATISFVRTFIFEVTCVLALPLILGVDGIWYSIIVAEVSAFLLTAAILFRNREKYHYM